jgi:hydrogenase nickel incorporation protein HypB
MSTACPQPPSPSPSPSSTSRLIRLEHELLRRNELIAGQSRAWLDHRRVVALNLMSSPGSGKTTLLERTITDTRGRLQLSVIQGDQATDNDAQRIRRAGARAVQINTGTGCHLDASMVARGLAELSPAPGSIVAIENVGNLVCPALFQLGEHTRIAILSVTEGADKPLKYPYLFRGSHVVVFNKADLLPHVDFDLRQSEQYVRDVNPDAITFVVSAKTGQGMDALYDYLARLTKPAVTPGQGVTI